LANHSKPQTDFLPGAVHEERRERVLSLMKTPGKRHELMGKLAHLKWLDERYASQIPGSLAHTADELVALLKRNGAGQSVWVISEDKALDGLQLPLDEAMNDIWGVCMFTALSCIPGKLAFVRGEPMKSEYLLQHP
jgi:hypothetical protein